MCAVAPLVLFSGHLYRVRRRSLAQYGDFASGYMQDFHAKWIDPRTTREGPLGTSDIQSLNDLGSAFQMIVTTRLFVFGMRPLIGLWAATIVPMVPLFASALSVEHLLKRIVSTVVGGLPI